MSRTMAAIGTMTATATMPPVDNPLEVDDEDAPTVASADDFVDEETAVLDTGEKEPTELDGTVWLAVEVMKIVVGGAVPPVDWGVSVTTEV